MVKKENKANQEFFVVVNPNAGSRKGEKDWPKIKELLLRQGFSIKSAFTENRAHAIAMTSDAIEQGYRNIIVVGGDGTLNEVVNGAFRQKACPVSEVIIGMISVGTGNDWGRMYEFPKEYKQAIKVIKRGHLFVQDAGHVEYFDENGRHERYFINVSGMGYDALVALKTNKMKDKGRGGKFAYMLNIFTGLFQYKNTYFDVQVDGKDVFSGGVLSMNLGICKYNGGGLMQVPNAVPDDGILDVTIIKATSKLKLVKHVAKLYDGSFIKLKFVSLFRGKTCRIVSSPKGAVYLEADGESLGHSPLSFSVIPKAVTFIIPGPEKGK